MLDFGWMHAFVGFIGLAIILVFLWRRSRNIWRVIFFSIFWIYLMGAVSVVAFPFPIDYRDPNFKPSINLVPFDFGPCFDMLCIRNIYENILLTVPFGFGVNFVARIRPKNFFWLAIAVGLAFEFIQFNISLAVQNSFRVVDINDVALNAIGTLLGYALFRIFGTIYAISIERLRTRPQHIFSYIYDVVCQI